MNKNSTKTTTTRRQKRAIGVAVGAVLAIVGTMAAVGAQEGEVDPSTLPVPDTYAAGAGAAGVSFVQFKTPNPFPVGPGAFLTLEIPEVEGGSSTSASTARSALVFPGDLIQGLPALLCTAGASPACGQTVPGIIAEAEHPSKPSSQLGTQELSYNDPALPIGVTAGGGRAEVTTSTSYSYVELDAIRLSPPGPAEAAVLDALAQTVDQILGDNASSSTDLVSVSGGFVEQMILPVGDGQLRAEARAVLNGVHLLAGAISIDAIEVMAWTVNDGETVLESGSTSTATGVSVGSHPASIGPDGIEVEGNGDNGSVRGGLLTVSEALAQAVNTASDKLHLTIRDGAASHAEDGSAAAADGLLIEFGNVPLTDAAPPQVPELCLVTETIRTGIADGSGNALVLPPICAVPDVTGTSDTYTVLLGRASTAINARNFPTFDIDFDFGSDPVAPSGGFSGSSGSSFDAPTSDLGSTGSVALPPVVDTGSSTGLPRVPAQLTPTQLRTPNFLAVEAAWLGGDEASGRITQLYGGMVGLGILLALGSFVVFRP